MRHMTIGVILPGTLPRHREMKVDIDYHPIKIADEGFASKWARASTLENDIVLHCAEALFRGELLLVVMRNTIELSGTIEASDPTEAVSTEATLGAIKEIAQELGEVLRGDEAWVFNITVDLVPLRKRDYH